MASPSEEADKWRQPEEGFRRPLKSAIAKCWGLGGTQGASSRGSPGSHPPGAPVWCLAVRWLEPQGRC